MKRFYLSLVLLTLFSGILSAAPYRNKLCKMSGYRCVRIQRGQSWSNLWPNTYERDIVMRVNRMNANLSKGMIIAVPDDLDDLDLLDVSPMPGRIEPRGRNVLFVDLGAHAFGAYDEYGDLVHWGPVSGGKGWCPDTGTRCRTPPGHFYVYTKKNENCVSSKFPIGEGGAPMPYCMFFYRGYALHGSYLPGYHASHGCIRLFTEDAEWLNTEFVNMGKRGTSVIVEALNFFNGWEDRVG